MEPGSASTFCLTAHPVQGWPLREHDWRTREWWVHLTASPGPEYIPTGPEHLPALPKSDAGACSVCALQNRALSHVRGERSLQVWRQVPVCAWRRGAARPEQAPEVQNRALPHLPHRGLLSVRRALSLHPQRRRAAATTAGHGHHKGAPAPVAPERQLRWLFFPSYLGPARPARVHQSVFSVSSTIIFLFVQPWSPFSTAAARARSSEARLRVHSGDRSQRPDRVSAAQPVRGLALWSRRLLELREPKRLRLAGCGRKQATAHLQPPVCLRRLMNDLCILHIGFDLL